MAVQNKQWLIKLSLIYNQPMKKKPLIETNPYLKDLKKCDIAVTV